MAEIILFEHINFHGAHNTFLLQSLTLTRLMIIFLMTQYLLL